MKARDLMVPLKDFLRPEMTLREAASLLKSARDSEQSGGVKGLPVLDDSGVVVGFLTMRDILKAVFPSYMSLMNLGDFSWDGMVEEIARKSGGRHVSEIMAKKIISVTADAPLMECVDHMLRNNVRRLPVLGADGRMAGIIYESDVFFAITRAMREGAGGENK